jgi:hypothetical protein
LQAVRIGTATNSVEIGAELLLERLLQHVHLRLDELDDLSRTAVLIFLLIGDDGCTSDAGPRVLDRLELVGLSDGQFLVVAVRRNVRVTADDERIGDLVTTIFPFHTVVRERPCHESMLLDRGHDQLLTALGHGRVENSSDCHCVLRG